MKITSMVSWFFVFFLAALSVSCGSAPPPQRTIPSFSRDAVAGANESEVVVQNTSSNGLLNVFIDGELVAQVDPNGSEKTIIPNGNHTIMAQSGSAQTNTIEFAANSKRIVFKTSTIIVQVSSLTFRLSKEGEFDLGTTQSSSGRVGGSSAIEGALERAADQTLKNVSAKSKIAILYITAQDSAATEYVVGELEYLLVNQGFFVSDRSQLDRLRREQNFQMSDEVDDATAVSIGKIAGANIIVTGRVDGEGSLRRLRLRALDIQTAQVVGVASERL
ncbi:MAG: hypothetical protein LBL19_06040 [Spirochaetaceae bacterium]|nr:hypothetical protein [Spirochaetaceae bacterium]